MNYDFEIDLKKYFFEGSTLRLFSEFVPEHEITVECQEAESDVLHKAVLNVAQQCNGQCVYCYEDGGHFGKPTAIMDNQSADKAIQYITSTFKGVHTVCFFGGEPTLNFKGIQYIVNELERHFSNIQFEITTNATNMNPAMLQYFVEHDFKITISIDGPEFIHNALRLNCPFDEVIGVIHFLKETPIANKLELNCTYTRFHMENMDEDILTAFFEELGVRYRITDVITEIEWIKLPQGSKDIKSFIDKSYERLYSNALNRSISSYVSGIINGLVRRKFQEKFCYDLCTGYVAVFDHRGNRHPCESLLYKCEVDDPKIEKYNTKYHEICKTCWAKGLCNDCIANFIARDMVLPFERGACKKQQYYGYALEKFIELYQKQPKVFQDIVDHFCG